MRQRLAEIEAEEESDEAEEPSEDEDEEVPEHFQSAHFHLEVIFDLTHLYMLYPGGIVDG